VALRDIGGTKGVLTWGVTPGVNNVNLSKWERIQESDVVLFARSGKIFDSSVVSTKTRNEPLADHLWGRDRRGDTWEFMYFVDELRNESISYRDLNEAAGYDPNNVIQGFNVLDLEKSTRIIERFQLRSETYSPPVDQDDYETVIASLDADAPLDVETTVKARTEQTFLRRSLFGNRRTGECGLCGREFPVSLLVASHIKRRADCSKGEKLDYKNVVMPMCKLGCDDLYEKGFLGVFDGLVIKLSGEHSTPAVDEYLNAIEGRGCAHWNENREKYFAFHRQRFRNV